MYIKSIKFIFLFSTTLLFYVFAYANYNSAAGQTQDLTGIWHANDQGTYYITQIGNEIWWFGKSDNVPINFANVFHGIRSGNTVSGSWADVPMGNTHSSGDLTLQIQSDGSLYKTSMNGGFFGSIWNRQ